MQDESHAVLLSSHITSDLDKIADNITFIHHGRVLLSEGRDELIDRHGVLRCTEEQLNALDPDAVRAVRKGAFGCEALVKRDGIPENWPVEPVSVEQIMMFLTKGRKYDESDAFCGLDEYPPLDESASVGIRRHGSLGVCLWRQRIHTVPGHDAVGHGSGDTDEHGSRLRLGQAQPDAAGLEARYREQQVHGQPCA